MKEKSFGVDAFANNARMTEIIIHCNFAKAQEKLAVLQREILASEIASTSSSRGNAEFTRAGTLGGPI